jgi:PTH1 family peptidyl-tRNA hydrolase
MIIIGLGNPGDKFKNTRHNAGFLALDEFSQKNRCSVFKLSKKFLAEISEDNIFAKNIILAKPQTFMNESGKAVKKILAQKKNGKIIVIHDDLDLPLGKIKIVENRGSGGHKGVESIIKNLGTENFIRIRIGIVPESGKPEATEKFVLENFKKEEKEILKQALQKSAEALSAIIKDGPEKAMNEYNK